jgi:hypothetical protein
MQALGHACDCDVAPVADPQVPAGQALEQDCIMGVAQGESAAVQVPFQLENSSETSEFQTMAANGEEQTKRRPALPWNISCGCLSVRSILQSARLLQQ